MRRRASWADDRVEPQVSARLFLPSSTSSRTGPALLSLLTLAVPRADPRTSSPLPPALLASPSSSVSQTVFAPKNSFVREGEKSNKRTAKMRVQWPQNVHALEICMAGYDGAVGMMMVSVKCLAGSNVAMAKDCIGADVDSMVNGLKEGEVQINGGNGGC